MQIKHEILKDEKGRVIGIVLVPDGESWRKRISVASEKLFPRA